MLDRKPQFEVAFDGETEYTWRGKRYVARHAYPSPHNHNGSLDEHMARIGCVWAYSANDDFPPAELMAHFPGYVAGRFARTGETYTIDTTLGPITGHKCKWETDGQPRVGTDSHGQLFAQAWLDELQKMGIAI
jgi:hypothetical protein